MSSSQNPLRAIEGEVIVPKSIQIISYHKKTEPKKSRATKNRGGSVMGGARRQSENLNLDLPAVP